MSTKPEKGDTLVDNETKAVAGLRQSLTPLQAHYYDLLRHLVATKNQYQADPNFDPLMMQAIKKAIYCAYTDCIEAQIGDAARELLRDEHQVN